MAKWLAIITRPNTENCLRGTLCVKDDYKSEISQVKVGDQFVMATTTMHSKSTRRYKWIKGLYSVTGEVSTNPRITTHSKNSYSHIVQIEEVRVLNHPWTLYAEIIYEVDLELEFVLILSGDVN
ncbi:MAG: hypothetical protein WA631_12160 [Nitrososphaeraceae archaeon]